MAGTKENNSRLLISKLTFDPDLPLFISLNSDPNKLIAKNEADVKTIEDP